MVIVGAHNIISPLGWTSKENFEQVLSGHSGIEKHDDTILSSSPLQAALINQECLVKKLKACPEINSYTKLEQLCILSLSNIVNTVDVRSERTGFIFSSTKGNVDQLYQAELNPDVLLANTAGKIADYFQFRNQAHVISNACISGLSAIIVAKRWIESRMYDDVVVLGADVLSKFIVSGFQSFQSLSAKPCKPFDKDRDGLTLGEGVASVVISRKEGTIADENIIEVVNGAISNDANHISGPSRTGEGLFRAIIQSVKDVNAIDAISAHGTATPYNDDMESQAITRAGLAGIPVSGLKGFFGHTLGAAGIIESLISIMALQNNVIIGTKGLVCQGVVSPINVLKENVSKQQNGLLKLMSGFGGCNAAIYYKKHG